MPSVPAAPAPPPSISTRRKLAILSALYLAQGLPFGFQAKALPIFLSEIGVDLSTIGFAIALSLPWALKAIWAPLVDRYWFPGWGRRKSWILPMQLALAVTCGAAAFLTPSRETLGPLLGLVFLMNLFAATMDIAVDGLAVELLDPDELGLGNSAQVVGYKLGMLTGGGLLVWASASIGWQGLFAAMAALVALVLVVTLAFDEPAPAPPGADSQAEERVPLGEILSRLWAAVRVRDGLWLLAFLLTYKLGESLIDAMWTPFLNRELGFGRGQLGSWLGVHGMIASLLGSLAGGLLATRTKLWNALAIMTCARTAALACEWAVAAGALPGTAETVLATICLESFLGGALTTVTFAFMMSRVDRTIGATHYTLLATVEVQGKGLAGVLSGVLAERLGYATLFGLGTVSSILFLPLLLPLRPREGASITS